MSKKTRFLISVIFLGIVDAIIPFFPVLALVLLYVILDKPPWFLDSVQEIYRS